MAAGASESATRASGAKATPKSSCEVSRSWRLRAGHRYSGDTAMPATGKRLPRAGEDARWCRRRAGGSGWPCAARRRRRRAARRRGPCPAARGAVHRGRLVGGLPDEPAEEGMASPAVPMRNGRSACSRVSTAGLPVRRRTAVGDRRGVAAGDGDVGEAELGRRCARRTTSGCRSCRRPRRTPPRRAPR